ncbi:MAG: DUF6249 domain-containing protein [candidate division WOR-3 bacterium]
MYCPRCGRKAVEGQKFCTGCGTNLLVVSQALAPRHATPEEERRMRQRLDQFRDGVRRMCVGIGLTILFYFLFRGSLVLAAVGLLVFFAGLGKVISSMVFSSEPLLLEVRVPSKSLHSDDKQLLGGEMALPASSEPPYVTEQTTVPLERPEYVPPKKTE